ncbi:MAG: hypothetical protein GY913_19635 [Proteobacteria bacterium]|nr:hypothetical protein [Pseudomonadota bacterium]MCP4919122.1 hypothetical protein [Pseudomonadota bacterium]
MITAGLSSFDPTLQRSLRQTLRRTRVSLTQLSSGRRINKAADDAAGSAIADSIDSNARSRRVAIRNIGDGLSALDVTDSGLSQIAERLKRARSLAIQASSETLDDRGRQMVQTELDETLDGVDNVAYSTMWGDTPLLSMPQVDVGLIVDVSGSMGGEIAEVKSAISSFVDAFTTMELDVGLGLAEMGPDAIDGVKRTADIADVDFDEALDDLGVWGVVGMDPYSALLNTSGADDATGENDPDRFGWRAGAQRKVLILITDTGRESKLVSTSDSAVGAALAARGIEVHTINPPSKDGAFSTIASDTGGTVQDIGSSSGSGIPTALDNIAASFADLAGIEQLEVQADIGSGASSRIAIGAPVDATVRGLGLSDVDLSTITGARDSIEVLDTALDTINRARAQVGGSTRRLEHALNYEENTLVNEQASLSRVRDVDMARVTAELAKDQILQQAAMAVGAQMRAGHKQTLSSLLASIG